MKNEMKNDEAVSPVIATILMVAITVVLAGVLYVWAQELANNQTEVGTFNSYNVEDAAGGVSNGMDDNLVRLQFSTGLVDLQWSFLTITLYRGDITYTCDNKATSDCFASESNADAAWNGNEVLVIQENGAQICDGAGATCDVKVTVSYKGKPVAGDSNEMAIS